MPYAVASVFGELQGHLRDTGWRLHIARPRKDHALHGLEAAQSPLEISLDRSLRVNRAPKGDIPAGPSSPWPGDFMRRPASATDQREPGPCDHSSTSSRPPIDGFVADPGGGDPSGPDGFFVTEQDYLDHLVEEYPETLPAPARQALGVEAGNRHFDTVVMGRRTYEIGAEVGLTSPYPQLRQYVVSRTMGERPDPAVEVVGGDPVAAVQDLKQADGKDIWLCGGGKLAAALRPEIDELVVKLNPVAFGSGVPLFDGPFQPFQFRLAASHALPSGVLFLTYRRAGS